jgi:hypothetical protein
MTLPPADYREEVDIVSIDPLFFERQRSRYASRGVAYLILLNGVAALALLASLINGASEIEAADSVVDAMLVFGAGAVVALASMFFAYLRRTVRLQAPERVPLRRGLWWLSLLAALAAAACFLVGLNTAGRAITPELQSLAPAAKHGGKVEKEKTGNKKDARARAEKRAKDKDGEESKKGGTAEDEKGPSGKGENDSDAQAPGPQRSSIPQVPDPKPEAVPNDPSGAQQLTRGECEEAGEAWNEKANVCD